MSAKYYTKMVKEDKHLIIRKKKKIDKDVEKLFDGLLQMDCLRFGECPIHTLNTRFDNKRMQMKMI